MFALLNSYWLMSPLSGVVNQLRRPWRDFRVVVFCNILSGGPAVTHRVCVCVTTNHTRQLGGRGLVLDFFYKDIVWLASSQLSTFFQEFVDLLDLGHCLKWWWWLHTRGETHIWISMHFEAEPHSRWIVVHLKMSLFFLETHTRHRAIWLQNHERNKLTNPE